jgi:uncharacterized protein YjcR
LGGKKVGRQKSPNRDAAFNIYKESNGSISSAEIAVQLGEKINNINTWRTQDKWKDKLCKVGAPYGNQNGSGNSGGGAPELNKNHYIHGLFSKYLPRASVDVLKDTEGMDPIDILYLNIRIKFAAIIRSQKIMFVKDKNDKTIEKVADQKGKIIGEKWEVQQAWDKQATFLKAQSAAMAQLTNMIKKYDEMLHANWDMVTEEQKLKIDTLKAQLVKLGSTGEDGASVQIVDDVDDS